MGLGGGWEGGSSRDMTFEMLHVLSVPVANDHWKATRGVFHKLGSLATFIARDRLLFICVR